jgi:hypothetical protein
MAVQAAGPRVLRNSESMGINHQGAKITKKKRKGAQFDFVRLACFLSFFVCLCVLGALVVNLLCS